MTYNDLDTVDTARWPIGVIVTGACFRPGR